MPPSATFTFVVSTGRENRPVDGGDTTIFYMPKRFYVDVDGKPTLAARQFSTFLRDLAEEQAANLGCVLHHADFWITKNPDVVREKGTWHDCPRCRESMARTMAIMARSSVEMVVGRLYWAG